MNAELSRFSVGPGETNTMNVFKRFGLRGSALDVVIALVLGAAFGAVVTALIKDVLGPINCP
jgi:large-conductance mechanosensitive channel